MTPAPPDRVERSQSRLVLDGATRRVDPRTLVGGSPLRVFRLSEAGGRAVDGWLRGEPVDGRTRSLARRLVDAGAAHPRHRSSIFTRSDVTVVVPVHDDLAGLAAVLACEPDAVAIDDAEGRGPAWARNQGWRRTTTPIVAFLDAGCRPQAGWLDRLLPHLADDTVAAVAPRVSSTPGPGWLARYEEVRSPLDLGPVESVVRPRSRVPYVPTAALVVRRADLELVGGFDESLRYGEDVDLVWRLAAAGRGVRYDPAVAVEHPPRVTLGSWLRQRFAYGTSAAPLARRHGSAVAPVVTSPWAAAAWALAAIGHPLLGLGAAAGTTAVAARRLDALPPLQAVRLVAGAQVRTGPDLAEAVRRAWWPFALPLLALRRGRRVVLAAMVVSPVADWIGRRRHGPGGIGILPWVALRLADDLAYGAGVWAGCIRARSFAALRPARR